MKKLATLLLCLSTALVYSQDCKQTYQNDSLKISFCNNGNYTIKGHLFPLIIKDKNSPFDIIFDFAGKETSLYFFLQDYFDKIKNRDDFSYMSKTDTFLLGNSSSIVNIHYQLDTLTNSNFTAFIHSDSNVYSISINYGKEYNRDKAKLTLNSFISSLTKIGDRCVYLEKTDTALIKDFTKTFLNSLKKGDENSYQSLKPDRNIILNDYINHINDEMERNTIKDELDLISWSLFKTRYISKPDEFKELIKKGNEFNIQWNKIQFDKFNYSLNVKKPGIKTISGNFIFTSGKKKYILKIENLSCLNKKFYLLDRFHKLEEYKN